VVSALVIPNLKLYGDSISQELEDGEQRDDAEMAASAVLKALGSMVLGNASQQAGEISEDEKTALTEKIGPFFATRVIAQGKKEVVDAVLGSKG
jgi:hypothetical protein